MTSRPLALMLAVALASMVAIAVIWAKEAPASANRVATVHAIRTARDQTWRWQDTMQVPRTRYAGTAETTESQGYRRWVLRLWALRARAARWKAQHPPMLHAWLCIHHYEGSWTDPNAPYYGGLQMDWNFMQAYGGRLLARKGTADHWTPLEQIWVAVRAYRSGRGFDPWPTTARWCGLL